MQSPKSTTVHFAEVLDHHLQEQDEVADEAFHGNNDCPQTSLATTTTRLRIIRCNPPSAAEKRRKEKKSKKTASKRHTFLDDFGNVNFGDWNEDYHPKEILDALPMNMQHKAKLALHREMKQSRGVLHWKDDDGYDDDDAEEEEEELFDENQDEDIDQVYGVRDKKASQGPNMKQLLDSMHATTTLLESFLPLSGEDRDTRMLIEELLTNNRVTARSIEDIIVNGTCVNEDQVTLAITELEKFHTLDRSLTSN